MRTYNLFAILVITSFVVACSNGGKKQEPTKLSEKTYLFQIDSMEKVLYANPEAGYNKDAALKMVNLYANTVTAYPLTPLAPDYLFKAGEISSSLSNSKKAIEFFKKAYEVYPDYSKAAYCLFLQAFIYENQLKQLGNAEQLYREVIKEFPKDKIAQDAQACINNLGKSDEQLIKEFEEKNKKNS
jgi:tetratricopeptide (TPR) repeat protein